MVGLNLAKDNFASPVIWLAFGLQMEYAEPTGFWKLLQEPVGVWSRGIGEPYRSFLCSVF